MSTEEQMKERRREYARQSYQRRKQYFKDYYRNHKERMDDLAKRHILGYRKRLVDLLGGKCARCGFSDYRALQIDHKNGGGRKETLVRGNIQMYLRYLKSPEEAKLHLQVLCANCNWIKRVENKEVKHK